MKGSEHTCGHVDFTIHLDVCVQVFQIGNVETPEDGVRLLHVRLKACIVSCFNEVVCQHVDWLRTPVLDPNFRSLPCLLEMELMRGGEKRAV